MLDKELVKETQELLGDVVGANLEVRVKVLTVISDTIIWLIDQAKVDLSTYCTCCGRGDVKVVPCPECGELICQDCTPPFGAHVCEPDRVGVV